MASTIAITRSEALAHFEALAPEDQWWMAENIMSILKGAGPLKPRGRKPKADKDSGSETSAKKRSKANLHHILTKVVKPALDAAAEDSPHSKLMKKGRAQKAVAQMFVERFADMDSGAAEAAVAAVTEDQVLEAFGEWAETPEANKPRKPRSTASSGSEAKARKPKLSEMSEEEKKAFYKARGEAAAAARAAKKTAKPAAKEADSDDEKPAKKPAKKPAAEEAEAEAEAESEAEEEAEEDAEPEAVVPYFWEHAMEGKEVKKYERVDIEGKAYLYNAKTKEFLGLWDEKKNRIKKGVEDPCA
jgi:hypothetical protein